MRPLRIGVIGAGRSSPRLDEWAETVGRGIAEAGAVLVAIGGGAGTLSEIGFALKLHKPLVLLGSWKVHPPSEGGALAVTPYEVDTPDEAVRLALRLARKYHRG